MCPYLEFLNGDKVRKQLCEVGKYCTNRKCNTQIDKAQQHWGRVDAREIIGRNALCKQDEDINI